jgi:hypothetical protein
MNPGPLTRHNPPSKQAIAKARTRAFAELRERMETAGFEPPYNVCAACRHHGGDHDLNNRCLICNDDYFTSMTDDQRWEYGLSFLGAAPA